jgi:hypothetical protein
VLAAPPSLSQLATSFVACVAKVSTVCSYFLFKDHFIWIEIAPTLFTRAAFHVWHMKVLLYAVFKDQRIGHPRIHRSLSMAIMPAEANQSHEAVPSKLNSAVLSSSPK